MPNTNHSEKSFPIVGIGASAGGMAPLQLFLAALPKDFDFALVFIQHLSSKHKSLLAELLSAKLPSLVIQEISDGLKAQPGRLYLSPPGREVRIQEGIFRLTVHPEGLIHLPIDEFLASLAEDASERAVAVIFSGAGSDGARGCKSVRNAGGTVYVQDPAAAEFPGMPNAVIANGQADAVLSPGDIAREIQGIAGSKNIIAAPEEVFTPQEYDSFCRTLFQKTGSRFNNFKKSVVSRRIRRRMYLHGVSSARDYLNIVSTKDSEASALASDLLIGVTSFFRDRVAWKALNLEVVRKLAAEDTDLPVRVWTPASATGEEAYSITMMLKHEFSLAGRRREIQVFASDVNNAALERAREGKYPASILSDVPQEYIQNYFTAAEGGKSFIVSKEIRELVVFARQDILIDPPFSKLNLVICRNFMIYLEPQAQEKCISLFHYALKDDGYLFLGNAETVGRKNKLFKTIGHKQCRVYRKLPTGAAARMPLSVPYAAEKSEAQPALPASPVERQPFTGLVQELLLEEFSPAAIAVDHNCDIVYHTGRTNRYLRHPRGIPTQNALELLPETLRNRVRGALYRAGQEGKSITIRADLLGDDGRTMPVTLRVSKVREKLSLIVFQEKGVGAGEEEALPLDSRHVEENAIHQLESELSATRHDLQNHIEQLKSVNEELQSSNEELQAANEELETSREELQSLNEELVIVNSQLQTKIEEQEETNNDLNNFISSTNIPTIFLDAQIRVKRFTPAMLKLSKLVPADVGRPIADLSIENLGPDIITEARMVLEGLVPVTKELQINGAWYLRTILPYRTSDSRIEGVVITYGDVTEIKKAEEAAKHLASFPKFNPNPILELSASGEIIFSNAAIKKTLEALGMDKEDLAVFLPHDIDIILRDLERKKERSLYRELRINDRIFGESVYIVPQFNVLRIYAFDITQIKKAEMIAGRLAAIVESADDAIISKDLNGIISTWNTGAEKIFGYTAQEAVGRNISFLLPQDQADKTQEIIKRISRGEHIKHFETERLRKDGTVIPVDLTFSAIKDADGKVVGVSKIAHNITERKRVENVTRARLLLAEAAYAGNMTAYEILRLTVDEIEALTDSEIGFYHFLEKDQETLSLQNWSTNTISSMCTAEGAGSHYNISRAGVWVDCVREKRPVIHNDYPSLTNKKGMPRGHAPIVREMVVPIFRGGLIVAIIGVGNKKTDYVDADIEIAKYLGDFSWEIVERKRAEDALREGDARVRRKLESVLSPEGDIGNLDLSDIIDGKSIQVLVDDFYELTHMAMAIIDLKGKVLVGVGWQKICTEFHRVHPETCKSCVESDVQLTADVPDGTFKLYKCKNNMWDVATPISVGGKHMGNVFMGQFFFDDELLDYDLFRAQARRYGFDEKEYIGALESVPRLSRASLNTSMDFFMKFADLVSRLSYSNIKLARSLTERDALMYSLHLSEEKFATAFASNPAAIAMTRFADGLFLDVNDTWLAVSGYSREEVIGVSAMKLPIWPTAKDAARFVKELREKGAVRGREQEFRKKSGEIFTAQLSAQVLTVRGDQVILSTLLDVTERKRAEDALKESESRYHALFDNMVEGFAYCKMLFDDNGQPVDFVYLEVNSSFARLTGLTDVVGKKVTEVIPGIREADSELFQIYGRVSLSGKSERLEFYVEALKMWSSLSVYCPEKEYFVAVFDVITERKRAEEEMRLRIEDLRFANEKLERFNRAAVGRELRMIELKKEVNELKASIGEAPPYPLDFEETK